MLVDAIAAERFRLLRDRAALFWGFAFVPLAALAFSLAGDIFVRLAFHRTIPGATTDLANRALGAVAGAAGPVQALFLLIGAAAIVAGDYRWETWRLLAPRNSRINLLAAKLLVFTEASAWSLLLTAICALAGGLFSSAFNAAPLVAPASETAFLGQFAGVFLITWMEMLLIGGLACLVGVITRSTMGAVIAGLVIVVVQSTAAAAINGPPVWKSLAVPAYAARTLKNFVASPAGMRPDGEPALLGLVFLIAWLAVLTAAALLFFKRQDLTKE